MLWVVRKQGLSCGCEDFDKACGEAEFVVAFEHQSGPMNSSSSTVRLCRAHARELYELLARQLCPICGGDGFVQANGVNQPCALCAMFEEAGGSGGKDAGSRG